MDFPLCYICRSSVDEVRNLRLTPGVYRGEQMMANKKFWRNDVWWRYYRLILLHPKKPRCQLSGIAFWRRDDIYSETRQVPWDKDTGVILSDRDGNRIDRRLLATATLVHESLRPPPKGRRGGILVHARCWDLLCTHRIWRLAGGDLGVILGALQRKSARDWAEGDDREAVPMQAEQGDPFYSARVQRMIRQAKRMTHKRFKVIRRRRRTGTFLNRLPAEVLIMVTDYLCSQDVSAVQKATGCYLGDGYWRSRTPTDLFHEVRALSDETLDWEFLCHELERFKAYWDDELEGRQWALAQLDEIASLMSV